jgi:exodeoxyribonuclease V alpha subunit
MAKLTGRVSHVRFQSPGHTVLDMVVEGDDKAGAKITVAGSLCGLLQVRSGVRVGFLGDWVKHVKYGIQLKPYGWFPYAKSKGDVERFLSACVEGFEDSSLVELMVSKFGMGTFDTLSKSPNEVMGLAGEDVSLRDRLGRCTLNWSFACSFSGLSSFLKDYSLPSYAVRDIYLRFGESAIETITQNPYRVAGISGITFSVADNMARGMGVQKDDPRRVEGAILWLLKGLDDSGHLFARKEELVVSLDDLIRGEVLEPFDTSLQSVNTAVASLVNRQDAFEGPDSGVYLPDDWKYERESAKMLAGFIAPVKLDIDVDKFIEEYERGNQISFSDDQRDGILKLLKNRVLALTGLPGTGKTTLIRAFVQVFKRLGISFNLMAPTGIASKRLAAVTGSPAFTIHRTFRYNGDTWGYNAHNKYSIGAVILDEMSMVDQELFYRVLDALHPETMMVMVGDDAQLPSVGPGNVLKELMSCPDVPHVRLTQIFRQAHTSEIVVASHQVNRGEVPNLDKRPADCEFQFVYLPNEEKICSLIVQMAAKLKGRDANFQVLSAKYDGVVGVTNLNERLREALNPNVEETKKECKVGPLHVRLGDRVMVIKNDYERGVYNGDMGKLVGISKENLRIRIHGMASDGIGFEFELPIDEAADELRLAYAVTVHKSQGSEFDTIILPMVRAHGRMLQRNLFYTAITRARKKVWVVGDPEAVRRAIDNDKVVQRNTVLSRAVSEALRGMEKS